MNTRLLRKLRQRYQVVAYKDPNQGNIFRLLYKNKKLDYAWVRHYENQDWRYLILGQAYNVDWKREVGTSDPDILKQIIEDKRKKRKDKYVEKRLISKARRVWP